jgi:hypothetical protein
MKKLILFGLLLTSVNSYGQTHIKNQRFVEVGLNGYDTSLPLPKGYGFSILTGKYNKGLNAHIFKASYNRKSADIQYSNGTIPDFNTNIKSIFVSYIFEKNLYRNFNNTFLINLPVGANLGYESINDNNRILKDKYTIATNSDYIIGPTAGIQCQYLNFSAGVITNLNLTSNYTKFSLFPTISYRYHL